jgi:dihydroxyacetone kinase
MAGASLTFVKLDDELEQLLAAPAEVASLQAARYYFIRF